MEFVGFMEFVELKSQSGVDSHESGVENNESKRSGEMVKWLSEESRADR